MTEDLEVNPGSFRSSARRQTDYGSNRPLSDNYYLKYIKKTRALSSDQGNRRSLAQKAEKITNEIIQDFLVWYNSLGGAPSKIGINHSNLEKLFQVGFDSPIADAPLQLIVDNFARAILEDSRFAKVRQSIMRESKMEDDVVGNRSDLESMATVWKGIENFRSTLAFCDWLKFHPEIERPPYLQNLGLMDLNYSDLVSQFDEFKNLEKEYSSLKGKLLFNVPAPKRLSTDEAASIKKSGRLCRRNVP